jgi:ureidoacrylate peracid hydrolase
MLEDATHQLGEEFIQRASIYNIEKFFGWVSTVDAFCDWVGALDASAEKETTNAL